jgi:hypothetical protein
VSGGNNITGSNFPIKDVIAEISFEGAGNPARTLIKLIELA